MKRHAKEVEGARCCWVCGELGGAGFTRALRLAGYEMAAGEMGYAHPTCMHRALRRRREPAASAHATVAQADAFAGYRPQSKPQEG